MIAGVFAVLLAAAPTTPAPRAARADAEAAEGRGDAAAADRAAERYLDQAGVSALIAAWIPGGEGPTAAEAAAALSEAAAFAATLADRHGNDALLVRALAWSPGDIDRFRSALARALARVPYLAGQLPDEQVDRLAAGDRTLLFKLAAIDRARKPGRAAAKAAGQAGLKWLNTELDRAQAAGNRDEIRGTAEAIVAMDADNVPALLALDLLQEDPRKLARIGLERAEIVSTWIYDGRKLVLIGRALADDPADTHMRLALAWRQLQAGLAEDARREAGKVAASPGASREARHAAEVIGRLAGLHLGRGPDFMKWSAGRPRSHFVDEWVANHFNTTTNTPDGVAEAWRQVVRRAFIPAPTAADRAELGWWAWIAFRDPKIDAAVRKAAQDVYVADRPALAPVARSCAVERLTMDACARRIELANNLDRGVIDDDDDDDDDRAEIGVAELPSVLGKDLQVPPGWLTSVANEHSDKLGKLAPWLDSQRARPVAQSPAFARLDVLVHWANKDAAGAARALDRTIGLPRTERLALRLIADGVAHGLVPPERAAALAVPPLAAIALPVGAVDARRDVAWIDEAFSGKDRLTALRRGQALLSAGHAARAVADLRPLLGALDGEDRAEIAGSVFLAAHAAHDGVLERRAAAEVEAQAPGSDVAAMVAAIRAGESGGAAAEAATSRWLRLAPSSPAAARAFLAAVAARNDPRPADPAARDLLSRAAKVLHLGFGRSGTVANVKEADAACWRAVLAPGDRNTGFVGKCPRAVLAATVKNNPVESHTAELDVSESRDSAAIVKAAREAAALNETAPPEDRYGNRLAWLWFVAGDYAKARAALKPSESATTTGAKGPGDVDNDEALRLLLGAPPIPEARVRRAEYVRFTRGGLPAAEDDEDEKGGVGHLDDAARARKAGNEHARNVIWHVGCLAAARSRRPQATLATCGEAWRRGRRTAATAVALGTVLFDNIEDARKQGLEVKTFVDQVNASLGGRLPGELWARYSAWLVSHDRMREAAAAAEQAWLAGAGHIGEGLNDSALGTAPFNPILARYRAAVPGSRTHTALGLAVAALTSADVDVAAGYVGQARSFFREGLDGGQERLLALLEDLLVLIDADLRDRALDGPGVTRLLSRLFDGTRKDPYKDIAKDYPRSALAGLLLIEEAASAPNPDSDEVARAKALVARFPRNAVVATDSAFLFRKAGLLKEAATTWNVARAARPGNPFLRGEFMVEKAAVPAVLTNPEAHARALAAPFEIPSDPAALRMVDSDELAFSVIVPAAFQPINRTTGIGFSKDGANLAFMRIPRATYCDGLACLDEIVPGMELSGFKQRWRRILTTPIGPAAEAFLDSPTGSVVVAAIPVGGHVYLLMLGGPPERVAAEITALRMVYLSFRPDDLAQPQPVANKLGGRSWDARKTLRLRSLLAKPAGAGCPIAALLDAPDVGAGERPRLVLDAFMTTPWAATRLSLLACEPTAAPGSPALTLASLWDEDQSVRRIGAARVAAHPAAVLAEAKSLMRGDTAIEPPAGSTHAARSHRWAALLIALPAKERGELARALLRQDEAHLRAVGLLAPRLGDVEIGPQHLRILRDGSPRDARIAAKALPDTLTRPMREAIWARIDRAKRPIASADADALFELAWRLTKHPDPGDRARLERLARLISTSPDGDRPRAQALLNARPEPLSPADGPPSLGLDRPLAEMLPGRSWTFVRIARPSALLARLSRLGHRLKAPTDAQQRLAQVLISGAVSEVDFIAADAGALDLDRPIECAALHGDFGRLLCAASTRADLPDDLQTTFRALDLLQSVGGGALALPIVLPALPFVLHQGLYAKGDATGEGSESALLRERAERTIPPGEAPGTTVAWNVQLSLAPDGSGGIADHIVLRRNDRLFFSNSPEIARRFLFPRAPPGPAGSPPSGTPAATLGGDPQFRQITARLVADADMTAIAMPGDAPDDLKEPIALELTVNARGVATRVRVPFKQQPPDHQLAALWRLLPKDPTLVFGAADISPMATASRPSANGTPLLLAKVDGVGLPPPTWLANATSAALFGWYPREGGRLWEDWFAAVGWDDKVAKFWRQHGMPALSAGGPAAVKDGYRFRLIGRVLVVSSADVLISEASHRAETEAAPAREEPVKGTFDGEHVAVSLEDRAARAPNPQAGVALRMFAAVSSVVKTATIGSAVSRDGDEVVIESLLSPSVETGSGASVVEEWQQERRFRNTLRLPKPLRTGEGDRSIRFVLEVEQDQQVRRAFPVTSRQKLEQVAPGRWRIAVAPGPSLADPVAPAGLSAADRQRYTDAGGITPRIRSAANEIVADKTPPKEAAQRILAWMKRNMTYELTPRDLRDEAILERRRGDCSEYSKLTVALLRAKGIPARLRSGFLADMGEMVAHAWVEFFDGTGWREIDPTEGSSSVDARHVDASLVDVMSLLSLAQIKIVGIE